VRQPSSSKSSRIVPYLAVLIKSINIEGTGGAAVQLRDPTGDVSASFNQSVFKKYPHLQKGSVLWLQRSGIFMDNCEPLLVAVADNIVQVRICNFINFYSLALICTVLTNKGLATK